LFQHRRALPIWSLKEFLGSEFDVLGYLVRSGWHSLAGRQGWAKWFRAPAKDPGVRDGDVAAENRIYRCVWKLKALHLVPATHLPPLSQDLRYCG
jgi:hypothetical protein